jgi:hypothetical protein
VPPRLWAAPRQLRIGHHTHAMNVSPRPLQRGPQQGSPSTAAGVHQLAASYRRESSAGGRVGGGRESRLACPLAAWRCRSASRSPHSVVASFRMGAVVRPQRDANAAPLPARQPPCHRITMHRPVRRYYCLHSALMRAPTPSSRPPLDLCTLGARTAERHVLAGSVGPVPWRAICGTVV